MKSRRHGRVQTICARHYETPRLSSSLHGTFLTLIYRYAVGDGPGYVAAKLQEYRLPADRALPEEEGYIGRLFNIAPGNCQLVYWALPGNPGNAPEEKWGGATLGEPGMVYALEYMKLGMPTPGKDRLIE